MTATTWSTPASPTSPASRCSKAATWCTGARSATSSTGRRSSTSTVWPSRAACLRRPSRTTTALSTWSPPRSTAAAISLPRRRIPPAPGRIRSGCRPSTASTRRCSSTTTARCTCSTTTRPRGKPLYEGHRAIWMQAIDLAKRQPDRPAQGARSMAASTCRRSRSGSKARISTSATAGITWSAPRAAPGRIIRRWCCAAARCGGRTRHTNAIRS